MAKLPAQAQAALDEAERIEQGITAPAPDPDTPPAQPEPEPAPAPEPEPAPAPAPEPAQPTADEDWKQKYHTLQGMHRADVSRLTTERDEARSDVARLTQELADAKKAPAPTPEPKPDATAKLVTEADAEAFGPDMIDLIQRAAREIAAQEIGPLKSELAAVKAENASLKGTVDTVAETQETEGRQKYYTTLAGLVPDYKVINDDAGFLAWLAEPDPLSGLQRQTLLNAAFQELDPQRTANLFTAYKATLPPPPAPAAATPAPKDDLTKQVQPSATTGHVPPQESTEKIWSPEEIDHFYKALARGEYKGKEGEAAKIEAEIDRSLIRMGQPSQ